jgi:hypothetical protein
MMRFQQLTLTERGITYEYSKFLNDFYKTKLRRNNSYGSRQVELKYEKM